jgi:hypothetical protein
MNPKTLADIVNEFQHVPTPPERIHRAASMVEQANERIVGASNSMLAFDDSPADFLALLADGQR